ncbi:MAG: hypothetical protein HRU40_21715 [Saprospiraceae bacterium]|nr:hypothetical protein [Saprospiraceae bacterium]
MHASTHPVLSIIYALKLPYHPLGIDKLVIHDQRIGVGASGQVTGLQIDMTRPHGGQRNSL